MSYNKSTGGAAIVAFASAQVGKNYSEQSPAGSDGDGHLWVLGEPEPMEFDCSGLVRSATLFAGCPVSDGNAQDQWLQRLGGLVEASEDLVPGDVGAFYGAENQPSYAGHTGIVKSYDAQTKMGVLINAYDTAKGVCVIPFNRLQVTNESNGLGVLGFYRPANSLPAAPAPAPKPKPEARPTAADLEKDQLRQVVNPVEGSAAKKAGFELWYWDNTKEQFVAQKDGDPTGVTLYVSVKFKPKAV